MKKRLLSLALCACLAFCAGCSTTQAQINQYNAVLYVGGVLGETYSGVVSDGYRKLVDITDEDARKTFENNLDAEFSQRLAVRFEIDEVFLKNDLKAEFLSLLETVYARVGFSAKAATPLEQGRYCVEVSVTPVTFFQAAYADGYGKLRADFEKAHPLPDEDAQADMTSAQIRKARERFETQWAQEVYDYLYARLDAITTGPAVTKLVLVTPDNSGSYTLSPTDLQDVDDLILQY